MVKLYDVGLQALKTGDPDLRAEALKLHNVASNADWLIVKAGISGTKLALDTYVEKGLGGPPRKPLPRADSAVEALVKQLKPYWEIESAL